MTTENPTTVTVQTTEGLTVEIPLDEANQKVANAAVREFAETTNAENKTLRASTLGQHLADIGLSPDKGLGKAIAQSYTGDPTKVGEHALEEYGHEKPAETAEGQPAPVAEEKPEVNVQAEQLAASQAQAAQAMEGSTSDTPVLPEDKTAEYDAKMIDPESTREDAEASVAHKLAGFVQENYGS